MIDEQVIGMVVTARQPPAERCFRVMLVFKLSLMPFNQYLRRPGWQVKRDSFAPETTARRADSALPLPRLSPGYDRSLLGEKLQWLQAFVSLSKTTQWFHKIPWPLANCLRQRSAQDLFPNRLKILPTALDLEWGIRKATAIT